MLRLKRIATATIALVLGLLANAWAGYKDGTGAEIPLGLNAQRIVCLAPNLTEMLWYLGLGSRQVGRSDFCDYPPEVESVESVGGFADTSLELVVALKPDLVVAYQGNSLDLVAQLRQLGIPVLAFKEAASLDEIGDQLSALYQVASQEGAQIPAALSAWRNRLDSLTIRGGKRCPKVFYGYPGEMSFTCGNGSFVGDLIARGGALNAAAGEGSRWPQVSAEYILASKPDVLLTASSCGGDESLEQARSRLVAEMSSDPLWRGLPAVQLKHVIVLDAGELLRPGPRILDALQDFEASLAAWQ